MRGALLTKRLLNTVVGGAGFQKRFRSDITEGNVRVRFAPSPTGDIHLGGLRTALYNYLFAKANNGTSILRIEDTDLGRKVEGATERLIEDLEWCGIRFDEGPYFQSDNRELYEEHAKLLVDYGEAYYCFCSEARLDLLRRSLVKSNEKIRYDNKCRKLTKDEVESKLRNNESYVIRFKLSDDIVDFNDIIFGYFHCNLTENEGDPIILKSDGYPTYHLANVVDDHNMKISHVFRGCEWLISTIKHMLIFKAFKWECPQYGHLPLLLNQDGKKFSKRDKSINIRHFRESGIFPNALLHFVTRAGGGFSIRMDERDKRIIQMEEFIEKFDMSKVNKNSCALSMHHLFDDNNCEMKRMLKDEKDVKVLIEAVRSGAKKRFNLKDSDVEVKLPDAFLLRVLDVLIDRINKVEDLFDAEFSFLWTLKVYKFVDEGDFTLSKMNELVNDVSSVEWSMESIAEFFRVFAEKNVVKYGPFMETLRRTLIGSRRGPPVAEIMILLGKENTIERLKMSIEN